MTERHEKWQRVEPGTHIEAGTPYRVEFGHADLRADGQTAQEHSGAGGSWDVPDDHNAIFIDSSWKPPLVLPTPMTLVVSTEDRLYDLLSGLNGSGECAELPAVSVVDVGGVGKPNVCVMPFLATLTDPDADHVNYVYTSESGHSRCIVQCENCGSESDRDDWEPTYPVTVMLTVLPDSRRCRDDGIDPWWLTDEQVARIEAAR